MSARVSPIKGKIPVAEPTVGSHFQIVKLAEIVHIQFQQVSQDRLLLRSEMTAMCAGSFSARLIMATQA
jgi:hypothetical protein